MSGNNVVVGMGSVITFVLSNKNSASVLANSDFPTPVGPKNKKDPDGRRGSFKPSATAIEVHVFPEPKP